MAGDFVIRPVVPDDIGRILDLIKLSLGEGKIPREREYWTWKHLNNPFGASFGLLAEVDRIVVGLRVFMRWRWSGLGATWPSVRAVDTATHPEWRRRGLFSRLTRELLEQMRGEGIAFVFNTPNRQSRPGYLKMGWTRVGRPQVWIRPIRPLKLAWSLLKTRHSRTSAQPCYPEQSGTKASELLGRSDLSQFLRALSHRNDRFATPLSCDYLSWRYVTIPGFAYQSAWDLDGDDGVVVVYRLNEDRGFRELRCCEVLVNNSKKSKRMGVRLLRDLLHDADVHYASAMVGNGTPEQWVLLRCGFLPVPWGGPVMTVRSLSVVSDGLDPRRPSDWRLSIGDLELF